MASILLEDNDIHYAYNCIHNFFDAFGINYAIKYAESAFKAATTKPIWKVEDPSGLLFFMENIEILCTAVFAIYYHRAVRAEAIIPITEDGEPDMLVAENFRDTNFKSSIWNNFPRNLTAAQYHNPYKAIKKFCRYMDPAGWKKFCQELTENAL